MKLKYIAPENKYAGIDFRFVKAVEAQYSKSNMSEENGIPFIEALPVMIDKKTLHKSSLKLIDEYNRDKVLSMSDEERCQDIRNLQNIRVPLPYLYQIYSVFYTALRTSYSIRKLYSTSVCLTIRNKKEAVKVKTVPDETGDPSNGFTLLGASGSGKTSSIMMMLNQFPQLIVHENETYGKFVQIVYLKVNCFPNSNLSVLLDNIGKEIDKALNNSEPIYERELMKNRSIGKKVSRICNLIEAFNIGALILDEIQLLDFDANKQASFESILALSNYTKVAIIAVGTEDAYSKMFPNLRTSRRTGICIDSDEYCENKEFFSKLLSLIWSYQWFDEEITQISQDISEAFYTSSKGIVDQMIKIYTQVQLEYLRSEDRPTVDGKFISGIVSKYFPGSIVHLKNRITSSQEGKSEDKVLTSVERQCFDLLKSSLMITKQIYNDESIINAIKVVSKRLPNADSQEIAAAAYRHLKRNKSDARKPIQKEIVTNEEKREKLLETVQKL